MYLFICLFGYWLEEVEMEPRCLAGRGCSACQRLLKMMQTSRVAWSVLEHCMKPAMWATRLWQAKVKWRNCRLLIGRSDIQDGKIKENHRKCLLCSAFAFLFLLFIFLLLLLPLFARTAFTALLRARRRTWLAVDSAHMSRCSAPIRTRCNLDHSYPHYIHIVSTCLLSLILLKLYHFSGASYHTTCHLLAELK